MSNSKKPVNVYETVFKVSGIFIIAYAAYNFLSDIVNIFRYSYFSLNIFDSISSFGDAFIRPLFSLILVGLLGYLLMKRVRYSEFFVMAYGAYSFIINIFSTISMFGFVIFSSSSISAVRIVFPFIISLLIIAVGFVCFKTRKKYA